MSKATCDHPQGCDRPSKDRAGPCGMHKERLRRTGEWGPSDPIRVLPPRAAGVQIRSDGYAQVWEPDHPLAMADGYVLEHRKVVHDAGIEVPAGHHVHHVNGDKSDNRLSNLEVKAAGDHHREHVAEAGYVTNQYGVWPLRRRKP